MYKLAIDFGGHYKGERVYVGTYDIFCKPIDSGIHNIGTSSNLQTLIDRGIIEKIQDPVWTDEDMVEFIARYCKHNFLPLNYIDKALNEFKIYKGKNS